MTALDIVFLFLLIGGAILGLKNGFVREAMALFSWFAGVMAVRLFHGSVTPYLEAPLGNIGGASALALLLLFLSAFFMTRFIGLYLGHGVRKSILGFADRALGVGFGMIKGLVVATLAMLLFTMIYDLFWPGEDLPLSLTEARSWPFLSATGKSVVDYMDGRKEETLDSLSKINQ